MFAAVALSLGLVLSPIPAQRSALSRNASPRMDVELSMSKPIEILPTPSDDEIAKIKSSWGTWGCGVSNFPWTYSDDETALILEGEVTVTPDDKSLKAETIKAGDYVKALHPRLECALLAAIHDSLVRLALRSFQRACPAHGMSPSPSTSTSTLIDIHHSLLDRTVLQLVCVPVAPPCAAS